MPLPLILAALFVHQDAFRETPEHRWAFAAVALARREGEIVGYPSTFYRQDPRPSSRYEMAVVFHAAATNQIARAEAFLKNPSNDLERASLIRSAILIPAYKRVEREFKHELVSLGVENDFGQSRLAELTRQIEATSPARDRLFSDVPADHWAAKAVGDLRALGLLDGYPDASFRG